LRGAFDHRGIDDLTRAAALHVEKRRHDAEREQHAAAAIIADEVERRHRRFARAADSRQHARQRDVVQIVPGALRERPRLSPTGHASVDELRIARERGVWAEAETLHRARTESFDDDIRLRHQFERGIGRFALFQIERDRAPAAPCQILVLAADLRS